MLLVLCKVVVNFIGSQRFVERFNQRYKEQWFSELRTFWESCIGDSRKVSTIGDITAEENSVG